MGFFKDVKLLVSQEEKLPFDSIDNTQKAILELLKTNHMDLSRDPKHTPNQMIVNTGILQVENSVYRARMVGQTDDLRPMDRYVKEFKMGIPHGYGDAVERVRHAAADDPAVAERIAKNPKQELLKIWEKNPSCAMTRCKGLLQFYCCTQMEQYRTILMNRSVPSQIAPNIWIARLKVALLQSK
jgi:hypothetical protein